MYFKSIYRRLIVDADLTNVVVPHYDHWRAVNNIYDSKYRQHMKLRKATPRNARSIVTDYFLKTEAAESICRLILVALLHRLTLFVLALCRANNSVYGHSEQLQLHSTSTKLDTTYSNTSGYNIEKYVITDKVWLRTVSTRGQCI